VGKFKVVAGKPAQARTGRHAALKPARSRTRRLRDHVVHNLINHLVWSTYLGLGVAVADSHGYLDLDHVSAVTPVISAVLAVLFWPIVFLGGTSVHA
jgi:hypothetical protein